MGRDDQTDAAHIASGPATRGQTEPAPVFPCKGEFLTPAVREVSDNETAEAE